MTIFFKNSSPKIPELHIFVPKFRHFCFFAKFLQSDKFENADFKYDNSFFKILAQKYPNKVFLVPNLGIVVFSQKLAVTLIQRC